MAASQNARFEEAFNKTRPWNARAYQHHANYHTASGGSYSASVPASTSGGSAGGSFHGQQSSVSSQSSFTSDESNTDYHTTLDDVPQPWTKPRSLLNGSNTSQGSLPSTPTTAIQARATQGLKSLKLGSSSRTSVHTSKQNSNLSSPVAESPSSMPFSSVTSDEFTSPSPIDEALDFVRDLREPYKPTRPKIPFQRSPSENAARELPSTSSHQATLYRSALRRHARNQSTDSVGSTQSDDAPVATPAPLPNNEDSVRFEHRHLQQLPVQYIDAIKSNVKRRSCLSYFVRSLLNVAVSVSLASNLLNSLPSEFISLGSHIRYLNLRINNFTEIPSVVSLVATILDPS